MDEEASKRTPRRVQMVMVFAGSEVKTTRKMVYSQDSVTCSSIIDATDGANSVGAGQGCSGPAEQVSVPTE
jgi:hypothetical protein